MTEYATFTRYALWAALIIVCAEFVWWMASKLSMTIFSRTATPPSERVEWQEKEIKRNEELAHVVAAAAAAHAMAEECE